MRHAAFLVPLLAVGAVSLACNGSTAPDASAPPMPSGAQVTVGEAEQASAAAEVDGHTVAVQASGTVGSVQATGSAQTTAAVTAAPVDKTPAPAAATGEYEGTWIGVCHRMDDCGCNPMASVPACARAIETAYNDGIAMARAMGTPPGMLATLEMDSNKLYIAANAQCATVCSEVAQYTGGGGGGMAAPKPSSGASIRIDATAGPNGGSITIEDDGWNDDW